MMADGLNHDTSFIWPPWVLASLRDGAAGEAIALQYQNGGVAGYREESSIFPCLLTFFRSFSPDGTARWDDGVAGGSARRSKQGQNTLSPPV